MLGAIMGEGMGILNSTMQQQNTMNQMGAQEGYLLSNMVRAPGLQKAGMEAAGFNPMLMAGPQSPFAATPAPTPGANPATGNNMALQGAQTTATQKTANAQADLANAQAQKARMETLNPGQYAGLNTAMQTQYGASATSLNKQAGLFDAQTQMIPTQISKLQSDEAANWANVDKTNAQATGQWITNEFLPKTLNIQNQLNKATANYTLSGIGLREAESKVAGLVGQGADAINGIVTSIKNAASSGKITDAIQAVNEFFANPLAGAFKAERGVYQYGAKMFAGDN